LPGEARRAARRCGYGAVQLPFDNRLEIDSSIIGKRFRITECRLSRGSFMSGASVVEWAARRHAPTSPMCARPLMPEKKRTRSAACVHARAATH
jgi:hypothetical protein